MFAMAASCHFLVARCENACHPILQVLERKMKIRYKKLAFSACSTCSPTNDSKSSKVSSSTASTTGVEDASTGVEDFS